MNVLLVSTYELGRQPFGLASPAAWLRARGFPVECIDTSRRPVADEALASASLIAFYLPMHTATRLALPLIARARQVNPEACLCAYGIYAALNADVLRARGVHAVFAGEFEEDLVELAQRTGSPDQRLHVGRAFQAHPDGADPKGRPCIPRLRFVPPDRTGLPPLDRYASVQMPDGPRRVAGYTEASRGCKHRCRHCPIVPVYDGQFRVVPVDVVLADIRAQVAAGAEHITFGDPDFFNGVTHARRVVGAFSREFAGLTYDVTIKVEHLLTHAGELARLRDTGCLFVTTAVESIDDRVLALLEKGHTRADFERVVALARAARLALAPTFVAFTPWTSLEGYDELLSAIEDLDLVDHVAPIQLAIRLLLPNGSRLLELPEVRGLVGSFDPATLTHRWMHPDPRVDALHEEVTAVVGRRLTADRRETFELIRRTAPRASEKVGSTNRGMADLKVGATIRVGATNRVGAKNRATVPYLNEPWYC